MFHLVLGPRIVRKCSPVTRILTWKKGDHGQCMEGGKQIVVLCVSQFPKALRSCGRSKQQGCVLCKNDGTKRSRDFLHICGASWISSAHLTGSATVNSTLSLVSNTVKRVNMEFLFRLSSIPAQFLVCCWFKTVWGSSFKEVFLLNSSFARWSTTEDGGKSDNNAVAVCLSEEGNECTGVLCPEPQQ